MCDTYVSGGKSEEALALTVSELARIAENGERQFESLLLALKGDAMLALETPNDGEAETCFCDAIDIARSQSAKMWELCASTRLARLWHSQGKTTEAYDLLAPVYGWFTEGFDTADLREAKSLLDELS